MSVIFSPLSAAIMTLGVVIALFLAWRPARLQAGVSDRMNEFAEHAASKAGEPVDEVMKGSFVDRAVSPMLKRMLQLLSRLSPAKANEQLTARLTVAGRPGNLGASDFVGLRVLLALLGLAGGFILGQSMREANPRMAALAPIGGALLGYLAPDYWLKNKMRARQDVIQRALPDALDMLTICVEAGLAFESAMQRVSEQWEGPLSREFERVVTEVRLGVARPQALRRMAARCDVSDVSSFVAVLVQADSMGTSVSQVLRSQSEQMRVLRRQRAEEKANKAPIKILVAMMLFIFPALFVVILGPAVPRVAGIFASLSK